MMITLDIPVYEELVIEKASQMQGVSVDEFILKNAYHSALSVIQNEQGIYLTKKEWETALFNLENAPNPNQAMQELLTRGRELIGD